MRSQLRTIVKTGARLGNQRYYNINAKNAYPPQKFNIQRRSIVTTLSDEKSVEKFRIINAKSILYFTATWCPPCKTISPIYDKMSDEFPSVAFGKVDVDDNADAAIDFEISAVPTFVLFEGEQAKAKFSGADAGKLKEMIMELDDN